MRCLLSAVAAAARILFFLDDRGVKASFFSSGVVYPSSSLGSISRASSSSSEAAGCIGACPDFPHTHQVQNLTKEIKIKVIFNNLFWTNLTSPRPRKYIITLGNFPTSQAVSILAWPAHRPVHGMCLFPVWTVVYFIFPRMRGGKVGKK